MPCYLFTFHAYGTWMPDRGKGYVHHTEGLLPSDQERADTWRQNMRDSPARFDGETQRVAIEAVIEACPHVKAACRAVATDTSHVHTLVSWGDESEPWEKKRASIKKAITLSLKDREDRPWLTKRASRKRVKDRRHFEYLVDDYLRKHRGWKWDAKRGRYR